METIWRKYTFIDTLGKYRQIARILGRRGRPQKHTPHHLGADDLLPLGPAPAIDV
jgi:hypothetical protein